MEKLSIHGLKQNENIISVSGEKLFSLLENSKNQHLYKYTKEYLDNFGAIVKSAIVFLSNLKEGASFDSNLVIQHITSKYHLSKKQYENVVNIIEKYIQQALTHENIYKQIHTETSEYYDNPKKLLADVLGIESDTFLGNITFHLEGGMPIRCIENNSDFQNIYKILAPKQSGKNVGGSLIHHTIFDKEVFSIFVNGKHESSKDVINHEKQHYLDKFLMPPYEDDLDRVIKSEVIAQTIYGIYEGPDLKESMMLSHISRGFSNISEGGAYNYANIYENQQDREYIGQKQLDVLDKKPFHIAEAMKNKVQNWQFILSHVPIKVWDTLIDIYSLDIN